MNEPLRLPPDRPAEGEVLFRAGGAVDSCSACLRVFGDDLDPDVVSAMMGTKPTSCCRKGDIFRGKRHDRIEKRGKWLLEIENTPGAELGDLVIRLLNQVTDDLGVWKELHQKYQVDLFCGLQMEQWNRGLGLSPQTLQRVAERGLELGLDIYYVGECDSPPEI